MTPDERDEILALAERVVPECGATLDGYTRPLICDQSPSEHLSSLCWDRKAQVMWTRRTA